MIFALCDKLTGKLLMECYVLLDVEKDIAQLIWNAVVSDDINKLDAWARQRPDALYLIDQHLHKNVFRFAIDNSRIRLLKWVLSQNNQPHFESLLDEALQSPSEWVRRLARLSLRTSLLDAHALTKDIADCWRPL
jgi:hypothetical protein